jgi:hypothetical protein
MELLDGFCPSFLKTNPVLADGVYGALTPDVLMRLMAAQSE